MVTSVLESTMYQARNFEVQLYCHWIEKSQKVLELGIDHPLHKPLFCLYLMNDVGIQNCSNYEVGKKKQQTCILFVPNGKSCKRVCPYLSAMLL